MLGFAQRRRSVAKIAVGVIQRHDERDRQHTEYDAVGFERLEDLEARQMEEDPACAASGTIQSEHLVDWAKQRKAGQLMYQ